MRLRCRQCIVFSCQNFEPLVDNKHIQTMLLKSSYAVLCHAMPCHAVLCCAALQSCWQSSKHSRYYSCHSLAASASLATRLPTVAQIITPVVQHKCMAYLRRMPHKQHGAAGNVQLQLLLTNWSVLLTWVRKVMPPPARQHSN